MGCPVHWVCRPSYGNNRIGAPASPAPSTQIRATGRMERFQGTSLHALHFECLPSLLDPIFRHLLRMYATSPRIFDWRKLYLLLSRFKSMQPRSSVSPKKLELI